MMIWLGLAGWLLLLAFWFAEANYRRRLRISRCEHRHGEIIPWTTGWAAPNTWSGSAPTARSRPRSESFRRFPGRDRFWYTRGDDGWQAHPVPGRRELEWAGVRRGQR